VLETFEAAVERFRNFIIANNCPPEIIWIRSVDTVFPPERVVYVKFTVASTNVDLARETYEKGMVQKRGVLFSTLCELESATCCFVWFPKDADEAERNLMPADGSLKMSVRTDAPRVQGKAVRNPLRWKLLQKAYGKRASLFDSRFL
jgi:hypothetical protein